MKASPQHEITCLLRAWTEGQQGAPERLMPLVYEELHRLARGYMGREREGHTLQATALVHETYLRLVDASAASFEDRAHFFGMCALLMRRILVHWARSRNSFKRGGDFRPVQLEESLVELRFFGGLSVEETAAVLKVSVETVARDWKLAKSWLRRELAGG
jgi:RNA polymerase sigma-70 factor, ECF subfamily